MHTAALSVSIASEGQAPSAMAMRASLPLGDSFLALLERRCGEVGSPWSTADPGAAVALMPASAAAAAAAVSRVGTASVLGACKAQHVDSANMARLHPMPAMVCALTHAVHLLALSRRGNLSQHAHGSNRPTCAALSAGVPPAAAALPAAYSVQLTDEQCCCAHLGHMLELWSNSADTAYYTLLRSQTGTGLEHTCRHGLGHRQPAAGSADDSRRLRILIIVFCLVLSSSCSKCSPRQPQQMA